MVFNFSLAASSAASSSSPSNNNFNSSSSSSCSNSNKYGPAAPFKFLPKDVDDADLPPPPPPPSPSPAATCSVIMSFIVNSFALSSLPGPASTSAPSPSPPSPTTASSSPPGVSSLDDASAAKPSSSPPSPSSTTPVPFLCGRLGAQDISSRILQPGDEFQIVIEDSRNENADDEHVELVIKDQRDVPRFSGQKYPEIARARVSVNELVGMCGASPSNIEIVCQGDAFTVHLDLSASLVIASSKDDIVNDGVDTIISASGLGDSGVDVGVLKDPSEPDVTREWWSPEVEDDEDDNDDDNNDDDSALPNDDEGAFCFPTGETGLWRELAVKWEGDHEVEQARHAFLRANPEDSLLACEQGSFLLETFVHEQRCLAF